MTIAEHIAAAIEGIREEMRAHVDDVEGTPARDFATAITQLEAGGMWATRGISKKLGIHRDADLQKHELYAIRAADPSETLP